MDSLEQQWLSEDSRTIELVVHTIRMGDVEDPDIMVAQPIYEWQQTEKGKYIMENSMPAPMWIRSADPYNYGYLYTIKAYLSPDKITYYRLKYE